jgi:hypothetical protein
MSRARAAGHLAERLTHTAGIPVTVYWDNPSGRPGHGSWRVEWTDGPSTATMRALAATQARFLAPLDIGTLSWARQYSPTAWAAALISSAEHGTLPGTAREAVALVEYDLHDTDATGWTPNLRAAAADLARRHDHDPHRMAAALIRAGVTKHRHETPPSSGSPPTRCAHCRDPLPGPAHTGRPAHWCSPACRQAAHRQRTAEVTKPRHETPCPACGRPTVTAATGRPARWCSPACRTRAWRTRRRNR